MTPVRFSSYTGAIIDYFDSIEDLIEDYQTTFDKQVHDKLEEGADGKPVHTIFVGEEIFGWARPVENKRVDS